MEENAITTQQVFGNEPLSAATLQQIHERWPWYVYADLQALEQGIVSGKEAQELRTRIALAIGDREALMRVLDPDADFADFYPDMQPVKLTTNDTIDAFLNRFGTPGDHETDLLTRMIFDSGARAPLSDDAAEEAAASAAAEPAPDATATRIDAFLATSRQPARVPEALRHLEEEAEAPAETPAAAALNTLSSPAASSAQAAAASSAQAAAQPSAAKPSAPPLNTLSSLNSLNSLSAPSAPSAPSAQAAQTRPKASSLSVSLAAMMIKNGNYPKALEIINELNLANPEKSIIFADQIRFLRKLIKIQEHQNR